MPSDAITTRSDDYSFRNFATDVLPQRLIFDRHVQLVALLPLLAFCIDHSAAKPQKNTDGGKRSRNAASAAPVYRNIRC